MYHSEKETWLAHRIKQGDSVYIVSDGSFLPDVKKGTAACVITASQDHRFFLMGNNLCPGLRESQCSYRSKLSGIIRELQHWDRIKRGHNLEDV